MGKGIIVSGGTNGLYTVKPDYDMTRLENEITVLSNQLTAFDQIIADLDAEIADWQDNIDQVSAVLDTMDPMDPEQIEEYKKFQQDWYDYTKGKSLATTRRKYAKIQKVGAEKKKTKLENLQTKLETNVEAWCADLTEDLQPDDVVATVEVPNEIYGNTIQIRPAYSDSAAFNAVRDGQMQPALAQSPAGTFFNIAMLPGKQKWKPQYRYGTVTAISNGNPQLATVSLTTQFSSQQVLHINKTDTLLNVPASYMDCDMGAFVIGDEVLVEFTGRDWDHPVIIGFKDHPRKCEHKTWAKISLKFQIDVANEAGWNERPGDPVTDDPATWYPISGAPARDIYYWEWWKYHYTQEVSFWWDCNLDRVVPLEGHDFPALTSTYIDDLEEWLGGFVEGFEIDNKQMLFRIKDFDLTQLYNDEYHHIGPEPDDEIRFYYNGDPMRFIQAGLDPYFCPNYFPAMPRPDCQPPVSYGLHKTITDPPSDYDDARGYLFKDPNANFDPYEPQPTPVETRIEYTKNGFFQGRGESQEVVHSEDPSPWTGVAGKRYNSENGANGSGSFSVSIPLLWFNVDAMDYFNPKFQTAWGVDDSYEWVLGGYNSAWPAQRKLLLGRETASGWYPIDNTYPYDEYNYWKGNDGTFVIECPGAGSERKFTIKYSCSGTSTWEYKHKWHALGTEGVIPQENFSRWSVMNFEATVEHSYQMTSEDDITAPFVQLSPTEITNSYSSRGGFSLIGTGDNLGTIQAAGGVPGWWDDNLDTKLSYDNTTYGWQHFFMPDYTWTRHKVEYFPWSKGYYLDKTAFPVDHPSNLQIGISVVTHGYTTESFETPSLRIMPTTDFKTHLDEWDERNTSNSYYGQIPTGYSIEPSVYMIEGICKIMHDGDPPGTTNPFTTTGRNGPFESAIDALLRKAHELFGEHQPIKTGTMFCVAWDRLLPSHRYIPIFDIKLYKVPKNRTLG